VYWSSVAVYVALCVGLAILGDTNHAIAMGCFAVGIVVLGLRDRFNLMPSNRGHDRRALTIFAGFMAFLVMFAVVFTVVPGL
jgi:hypothetical protein